ncbi:lipase family protein [Nocardia sp. NPDC004068]|uniref:lipase family protein n=1 Tax=Nocardia sp. NPDC004068 TaxID=3364303 RepID=UPI00368B53B8
MTDSTHRLGQEADEFYHIPVIPPGTDRGTILRSRAIEAPQLPDDVTAIQVVYVSSQSYLETIPASGTVLIPQQTHTAERLLLVFCPAFRGLGPSCAPSQLLARGSEPEISRISAALRRGWTVSIPDGENLGIDLGKPHTWLATRAAAYTALDLARAATRLPNGPTTDTPVVVWGYGDGGRTAVAVAEHHLDYAADVAVRGLAAGAVVSDPGAMADHLDHRPWAGLGLAGLIGLATAYSHLPLLHQLTAASRGVVETAATATIATLWKRYRQPLGQWCARPDPWEDPMWRFVLAREVSGTESVPSVPVLLYHGVDDVLVPAEQGFRLAARYRGLGVDVAWREYPTGHRGAAAAGVTTALDHLQAHAAHGPTARH